MRRLKKILLIVLLFFIPIITFISNGVIENARIKKDISSFKARGVFLMEKGSSTYYIVPQQYEYEDISKETLNIDEPAYPGAKGDILLTNRNPWEKSKVIGLVAKTTWIGHAALISSDDSKKTIHIVGNQTKAENIVAEVDNNWINYGHKNDEIAIVRIKDITNEEITLALDYAYSKLGAKYNYTFFFNRKNTFYCSDLVSRAMNAAGININYDGLVTTGADILVSKSTYLVYYREKIIQNNEIKYNVYFLGDPNDYSE